MRRACVLTVLWSDGRSRKSCVRAAVRRAGVAFVGLGTGAGPSESSGLASGLPRPAGLRGGRAWRPGCAARL